VRAGLQTRRSGCGCHATMRCPTARGCQGASPCAACNLPRRGASLWSPATLTSQLLAPRRSSISFGSMEASCISAHFLIRPNWPAVRSHMCASPRLPRREILCLVSATRKQKSSGQKKSGATCMNKTYDCLHTTLYLQAPTSSLRATTA
jgi:hypothetical protein